MWVFISIFLSSAKVKSTVEYRPGVLELSYGQGIEPREFINLNRKKMHLYFLDLQWKLNISFNFECWQHIITVLVNSVTGLPIELTYIFKSH